MPCLLKLIWSPAIVSNGCHQFVINLTESDIISYINSKHVKHVIISMLYLSHSKSTILIGTIAFTDGNNGRECRKHECLCTQTP